MRKILLSCLAAGTLFIAPAYGQDSPSLGDAARQARQQKQQKEAQAKDAPAKAAAGNDATAVKTPKVITNDEIPEHVTPTVPHERAQVKPARYSAEPGEVGRASAAQWKNQILQMKNSIASAQAQIDQLNESIHYAPSNCVSGCTQWNERQQQKQQQVESMKSQLEEMRKQMEDMQETARQQGYGSAVYDP